MDELLLGRSCPRHMHLLGVRHVAGDFFEELTQVVSFRILGCLLVGVGGGDWILSVAQYGKFLRSRVRMTNDGGMVRVHPNAELLLVFY